MIELKNATENAAIALGVDRFAATTPKPEFFFCAADALVRKLSEAINARLKLPELRRKLAAFGANPIGGTPQNSWT